MKKTSIIALVVIAVAVAVLVSVAGNFGSYSTFADIAKDPNGTHQVAGSLSLSKEMVYDPKVNPNFFTFFIKDKNGVEKKVIYNKPKPFDFERSEQIVLTGHLQGEDFVATDMLLKCPSKYKEKFNPSGS